MTEGPYPNHLARFMRTKGLTDPDLARLLDISKQQIFNLRRGHRKLTVEWARRLAPHLDVSWQELITGSPTTTHDPELAAILAAYAAMDQRDREALSRVAQSMAREDTPPPQPKGRSPPPHPPVGGNVNEPVESYAKGVRGKVVKV
jgi:transcriptional regulator with XRE-family HTH domain